MKMIRLLRIPRRRFSPSQVRKRRYLKRAKSRVVGAEDDGSDDIKRKSLASTTTVFTPTTNQFRNQLQKAPTEHKLVDAQDSFPNGEMSDSSNLRLGRYG